MCRWSNINITKPADQPCTMQILLSSLYIASQPKFSCCTCFVTFAALQMRSQGHVPNDRGLRQTTVNIVHSLIHWIEHSSSQAPILRSTWIAHYTQQASSSQAPISKWRFSIYVHEIIVSLELWELGAVGSMFSSKLVFI